MDGCGPASVRPDMVDVQLKDSGFTLQKHDKVSGVDLRRLRVLRMVHEYGTVTAASDLLGLTPSAVSHQLRQLAREVGVTILVREGRGVRLTPAGRRLVAHADALQAVWEQARADLGALEDGDVGLVRLGAGTSALVELAVPAAARVSAVVPAAEVRLRELERADDGLDLLRADELDVALVAATATGPPLDDPRIEQAPLLGDPLDLVVPADHPLADRARVELTDTAREPWILPAPGAWDCHELVGSACAAAGFAPNVLHRATSTAAIERLVGAGHGVTLLPRLAALGTGGTVVRVPLAGDPPPARRLLTCVRRGSAEQPLIARALMALRNQAAEVTARTSRPADDRLARAASASGSVT